MQITSISNQRVKYWTKLKEKKYRDREQRFLIEGEHLLQEAYTAGCLETIVVEEAMDLSQYEQIEVVMVTKEIMKKLVHVVSGNRVVGVCKVLHNEKQESGNVILLDDIQDPGNLGTILRSAHAFGYHHIVLSLQCVDIWNDKVIRSTQGALFHLNIKRMDLKTCIQDLKKKGYKIYATALQNARSMQKVQLQQPCALVFGNEGSGVSKDVLALSDQNIKIEMETFESLNVAVAAGICMYHMKYAGKS